MRCLYKPAMVFALTDSQLPLTSLPFYSSSLWPTRPFRTLFSTTLSSSAIVFSPRRIQYIPYSISLWPTRPFRTLFSTTLSSFSSLIIVYPLSTTCILLDYCRPSIFPVFLLTPIILTPPNTLPTPLHLPHTILFHSPHNTSLPLLLRDRLNSPPIHPPTPLLCYRLLSTEDTVYPL